MACLVLKGLEGERRIPQDSRGGFRYAQIPGEKIVGIDPNCQGAVVQPVTSESSKLIAELDAELGKGGGDWLKRFLKPAAKLLGKSNCMSCEGRRVVTNAYGALKAKHGQLEALRMIKDLWHRSFSEPEAEILKTLKEYLSA
jgi:hypothetical protein